MQSAIQFSSRDATLEAFLIIQCFEAFIRYSAFGTGVQINYEKEEWESDDEYYGELDAQFANWAEQFPEALKVNKTLTKIDLTGMVFSIEAFVAQLFFP